MNHEHIDEKICSKLSLRQGRGLVAEIEADTDRCLQLGAYTCLARRVKSVFQLSSGNCSQESSGQKKEQRSPNSIFALLFELILRVERQLTEEIKPTSAPMMSEC